MMRFFKKRTHPSIDRESSTGVECTVCAESRVELIDGRCVSCALDAMGATRGNDVPRKFSPRGQEPRDVGVPGRKRAS